MKKINKQLKSFDNLYRKSLQDNMIDRNEKKIDKVYVIFLLDM